MGVQHATGLRQCTVDTTVDEQCRGLDLARPINDIAVMIDEQHVTGPGFRPVLTKRVHHEMCIIDGNRIMIADAFAQAQPAGPAKGSRQIPSHLFISIVSLLHSGI